MDERAEEWFAQAEYDLDTARYRLRGGRRFYAVFMAHLSLEKALKGRWQATFGSPPPKTHNLLYLADKVGLQMQEGTSDLLTALNDASVATRYPGDLKQIIEAFPQAEAQSILAKAQETLAWIKAQR